MKRIFYGLFCSVILLQGCWVHADKKELYNEDFRWTITIPEKFENVDPETWEKMQDRGIDAVERTYGEELINQANTIFVFKSGQLNYMEANYQPFDPETDGDYSESCKMVNEMLYETFKAQMPDARVDTLTTIEKIDGLDFHVLKTKITYPNKMILNALMFSRLFDKKEFSINLIYVNEEKGEQMLDAWKNSKFAR